MNPPKSILDPSYRYTNAANTNLEKTFARIRREMKEQKEREQANAAEARAVVRKLKR